jgi:hypothetical protein
MPVAMRSAQSLPPRSSLTADSYRALERSLDAAGQVRTAVHKICELRSSLPERCTVLFYKTL